MKNDNNTVDLDDFWAELIDKSEWSKNEALKTPSEFRNLNILDAKIKKTASVPIENKVEQPQNKILKTQKKSFLLIILRIVLFLICISAVIILGIILWYNYYYLN